MAFDTIYKGRNEKFISDNTVQTHIAYLPQAQHRWATSPELIRCATA